MKHLLLKLAPHVLWLCVIIALLILLQRGCNDKEAAKADARKAHTLRRQALDDAAAARQQAAKYQQDSATAAQRAQQAAKSTDAAQRRQKLLEAEIKQLYAELGKPWPRDTVTDKQCCDLARDLVTANELHRAEDSAKDMAVLDQLDLATERIDTLNNQLARANSRFLQRDSIPIEKLRGSLWFGVEGQAGPTSGAGLYLKYQTPRGKEYTVSGGRQPLGWYGSVKIGTKISLRKKRKG